jgi:hypothetical protein
VNVQLDKRGRLVNHIGGRLQLPAAEAWEWRDHAACDRPGVDHEWFFSSNPADIDAALTVCDSCPVTAECGMEQARIEAPGVWGGVRWVEESGKVVPTSRVRPKESRAVRDQMLRRRRVLNLLSRGGMSTQQVADVLGVHRQTVRNDMKAMGL